MEQLPREVPQGGGGTLADVDDGVDGEEGIQLAIGAQLVQVELDVRGRGAEGAGAVLGQELPAVAGHAVRLEEQTVADPDRTNRVEELPLENAVLWAIGGVVAELGPHQGGEPAQGQHVRHAAEMVPFARLLEVVVRVEDHPEQGGGVEGDGVAGPVLVLGPDHAAAPDEVECEDVPRGDGGLVAHAVVTLAHAALLRKVPPLLVHKLPEGDVGWGRW